MSTDSRETLLVVDDDRPFCAALAAAVRRRGYSVAIAHNFDDGLAEAEVWLPSKAIVDLRMPGRSGLELVAALRSAHPGLQIVVLTGFGSIATAVEAIKLGARHYLTKPATADDILASFGRNQANPFVTPAEDPMPLDDLEWEHIEQVLRDAGGNISQAARRLGIHRRTLQRKLARRRSGDD